MKTIKIREDLHNQYINQTSNMTFKELEDNYNRLAKLLNTYSDEELYAIYLIDNVTGKYLQSFIDGVIYKNKEEALKKAEELNEIQASGTEEYCIESVIKSGTAGLAKLAYEMLNT